VFVPTVGVGSEKALRSSVGCRSEKWLGSVMKHVVSGARGSDGGVTQTYRVAGSSDWRDLATSASSGRCRNEEKNGPKELTR
jgi:hypothetical protein